jgi:hypothetical protein
LRHDSRQNLQEPVTQTHRQRLVKARRQPGVGRQHGCDPPAFEHIELYVFLGDRRTVGSLVGQESHLAEHLIRAIARHRQPHAVVLPFHPHQPFAQNVQVRLHVPFTKDHLPARITAPRRRLKQLAPVVLGQELKQVACHGRPHNP